MLSQGVVDALKVLSYVQPQGPGVAAAKLAHRPNGPVGAQPHLVGVAVRVKAEFKALTHPAHQGVVHDPISKWCGADDALLGLMNGKAQLWVWLTGLAAQCRLLLPALERFPREQSHTVQQHTGGLGMQVFDQLVAARHVGGSLRVQALREVDVALDQLHEYARIAVLNQGWWSQGQYEHFRASPPNGAPCLVVGVAPSGAHRATTLEQINDAQRATLFATIRVDVEVGAGKLAKGLLRGSALKRRDDAIPIANLCRRKEGGLPDCCGG